MQLSETSEKFSSHGIEILTVTYDSTADAKTFINRREINFPILHDSGSDLIKQLGILNPGPDPYSKYYGIPFPGIFLVDTQGMIRAKFAEEKYQDRPKLEAVLAEAMKL